MKISKSFLVTLVLAATMTGVVAAADTNALARPEDFPRVEKLPDPFLFLDGSRVASREDWARRREEIKDLMLRIQYGHLPESGGPVNLLNVLKREIINDGMSRFEKHELSMGPEGRMRAEIELYFPVNAQGPCPVILCIGRDAPIIREINERGYIFAGFAAAQFDESKEGKPTEGQVQKFFPACDGGTLAAWAWGACRMLDYLHTLPQVDSSKVVITGHSRSGKAALLAGAMDERFAIVNPNGSGCGGAGLYRILGPISENLHAITHPKRWQEWFQKDFGSFAKKEAHLPFDQHFMRALVAPRRVLSTDGTEDHWANPLGTQINYLAAQPVFNFLGVTDNNAMFFRPGEHDHSDVDFRALLEFADLHFFGKQPSIEFNKLPLPDEKLDVDWVIPG